MSSSKEQIQKAAWAVWIIASIFYAYQYILRVIPNILLNDIMLQFDINAATFGQFSGIYYIGYSLMHLPIGIMLDRYGPKKVMSGCILLTVVGLLPLIFSTYWIFPIAGRLLIGIGSSAAILGLFKIIRMTFDETRFSRMLSLSVTIGLIGAIYGGGPISYMRDSYGYESVIHLLALAGLVLAAFTYWIVPNIKSEKQTSVTTDIKEVLMNKRVILCCFFAGLMVGPLEGFADVWGTAFLKQVYGYDGALAASIPSTIFIGMCFGSPILSMIAERFKNHLGTIVGAGVLMVLSFFVFLNWYLNSTILTVNFVVIGVCCAYQILAIYKASTYVREGVAGLTTAVANMIIMIFGYAFHTVIGGVVSHFGGPNNPQALIFGVSVVPVALFIGTLGFFFLLLTEPAKEPIKNFS